jgi:CHASE2 domain-containing sensor protein
MRAIKLFFTEYLFLNLFIFGCVSLLSLFVVNISFFDPFTQAFEDFSLTDLYYSKIKNRSAIYEGPVVLVNIENRNRSEIAVLLERIQEGKPKTIVLDVVFANRQGNDDSLLQQVFNSNRNYVFGYAADFNAKKQSVYTHSFFTPIENGYVNLVGEDKEFSTIRYYYPFFQNQSSLTSRVIEQYDKTLYGKLLEKKNRPLEIHYNGNLGNFRYYYFDEVTDADFNTAVFKNQIVMVGYLGLPQTRTQLKTDEDKFFTPLNPRLSGRSYPDMYGTVIHANILRMLLEDDFVKVVPKWKTALISFFIIWLLLPLMCGLFFKGDVWFNTTGTLVQLFGSIAIVFCTVLVYKHLNTRFDPGLLLGCLVLLPTFINLYEALLVFLRYKLRLRLHSRFLEKDHND